MAWLGKEKRRRVERTKRGENRLIHQGRGGERRYSQKSVRGGGALQAWAFQHGEYKCSLSQQKHSPGALSSKNMKCDGLVMCPGCVYVSSPGPRCHISSSVEVIITVMWRLS